jgi:hypothetical protein
MSHFTRVKTKMTDGETIRAALGELGYTVLPGEKVAGFVGRTATAEFKIKPTSSHYEIGFSKTSSGYVMIADWTMLRMNQAAFSEKLMQKYGRTATIQKLADQGYELVEEKVDQKGEIRMLLRRSL